MKSAEELSWVEFIICRPLRDGKWNEETCPLQQKAEIGTRKTKKEEESMVKIRCLE